MQAGEHAYIWAEIVRRHPGAAEDGPSYDVTLRHSDRLRLFAVPVCFLCGAEEAPGLGWRPATPGRITRLVGMVPDSPLERISFAELAGDWTETWRGARVALRVVGCQVCWCPESSTEAVLPIGFFREYGEKGGGHAPGIWRPNLHCLSGSRTAGYMARLSGAGNCLGTQDSPFPGAGSGGSAIEPYSGAAGSLLAYQPDVGWSGYGSLLHSCSGSAGSAWLRPRQ